MKNLRNAKDLLLHLKSNHAIIKKNVNFVHLYM